MISDNIDIGDSAEARARRRLRDLIGMAWHIATYLIINVFLWFIDSLDDRITWAYWVTAAWGIGVAFHAAAVVIGEESTSNPLYAKLLEREREREDAMSS